MSWIALGAAAVSAVGSAVAAKKGTPKVASYTPVDIQDEQGKAIEGNIAQLDNLAELSSGTNDIATKNLLSSLEQIQPGYGEMSGQVSDTISSYLRGEIPEDVANQISRFSAEQSVFGGYGPDSGMGRALTARDLGLTSLNLVDRGLSAAQSWLQQSYSMTPKFDFTSMFITPAQQAEITLRNNQGAQNQQQNQYNMDAQKAAAPWAGLAQGAGLFAGAYGGGGFGRAAASSSARPGSTFQTNSPTFQIAGGMFNQNTPALDTAAGGQTFASGFFGR